MPTSEQNRQALTSAPRRLIRLRHLPVAGALAVALLSTGWSVDAMARSKPSSAVSALDTANPAQAIVAGEAALRKQPRDAAMRAALGRAYLRSGRFESAATVLTDAMTLGDTSPRTVLSLALARTAIGQERDALAILQPAQASLPAADFGLALALAGDPARGITLLAEAARAGQSSEKLRQNLAYAYALDGRWGEARTIVAMDLPADKVDARLTQWAASARPDAVRARVAALLGAPLVNDAGLPATLALNGAATEHLAVKAPVASPMPAPEKELPALTSEVAPTPVAAPEPVVEPLPAPRAMGGVLASAQTPAFTPVTPQGYVPYTPVSKPVASPMRVAYEKPRVARPVAAKPVKMAAKVAKPHDEDDAPRAATGTHLVQLGAFTTSANAERARKTFLAHGSAMRSHDITITKAVVNGRDFWRVAAGGFDSASASGACGRVKKSGGACFAYESGHLPAGQALAMAAPAAVPGRKR